MMKRVELSVWLEIRSAVFCYQYIDPSTILGGNFIRKHAFFIEHLKNQPNKKIILGDSGLRDYCLVVWQSLIHQTYFVIFKAFLKHWYFSSSQLRDTASYKEDKCYVGFQVMM